METGAPNLTGVFNKKTGVDDENIRCHTTPTTWRAPGNGADGNDFCDTTGLVYVNGVSGFTHDNEFHILMEESPSAPVFSYQLSQTSGARYFKGDIAEVIIYNAALTVQERADVTAYLDGKWWPGGVSPNLVAHWKLDETSGAVTAVDETGNYDGTNSDAANMPGYAGKVDGAYRFVAADADDYIDSGATLLTDLGEYTLAGWVNPAVFPQGTNVGLWGQNDNCELGFQNGDIQWWTPTGGGLTVAYPYPAGQWHHVAVVAKAGSKEIYLDGVSVASGAAFAASGDSAYTFKIGGGGIWNVTGNWFDGMLDDVRVYNRALTTVEIQELVGVVPAAPLLSSATADDPPNDDTVLDGGDTLTLVFDIATNAALSNATGAQDVAGMNALFSLSAGDWGTSDSYTLTWINPTTLEIEITSFVGANIAIGETITTLAGANILNAASAACTDDAVIGGDWGTFVPSVPAITGIVASDPDNGDAAYGDGDRIEIAFDIATNSPAGIEGAHDGTTMGGFFALGTGDWGDSGDTYDVSWVSSTLLKIDVTGANNADVDIGYVVTLQAAAGITNLAGTSAASVDADPITGDWGTFVPPAPAVTGIVARDPDNGDTVFGDFDTITIVFDVPTTTPAVATGVCTGAAMPGLIALSSGTWGSALDTYVLSWPNASTLVISVSNHSIGSVVIGSTLTVLAAADIRNGASAPSTDSATLAGNWGFVPVANELPGIGGGTGGCGGGDGAGLGAAFAWLAMACTAAALRRR